MFCCLNDWRRIAIDGQLRIEQVHLLNHLSGEVNLQLISEDNLTTCSVICYFLVMIDPENCRAARALINWSQQQLAKAANVGVSAVKNFEAGHRMLTPNNLAAIQNALKHAGVEFVSEEQGGPGVLARRLRLRAYIPGEGLHLEVKYIDLLLKEPDNDFDLCFKVSDFDLWFKISDAALATLAGRPIVDEVDAKAVSRMNNAKLIRGLKEKLARDGLSSPGGKPREITPENILGTKGSS
jgi:transcriptional regulator with XRE-family HTH domain